MPAITRQSLQTDYAPMALSILRVVIALIVLEHGMQKLFGFPPGGSRPAAMTLIWFAAVIELVGGALLLVGLFTNAAAFVLSGEMAFAFFIGHFPRGGFPANNGGDLAIALCFALLFLAAAGGGLWSVDAQRRPAGLF